jgi:hypothetical protein
MKDENTPTDKDVGILDKQVIYHYSNILVCVFASVVLGELVGANEMRQKEFTDKLVVRLDTLGWLPLMHELGDQDEFCKTINEMVDEGKDWTDCLSTLSHMVLYLYDGVEGMVRKRDEYLTHMRTEARTGMTKDQVIKQMLDRLAGKIGAAVVDAANEDGEPNVTIN